MRIKFYINGSEPGKQGTVHLEVREVRERWEQAEMRVLAGCDTSSCSLSESREWGV